MSESQATYYKSSLRDTFIENWKLIIENSVYSYATHTRNPTLRIHIARRSIYYFCNHSYPTSHLSHRHRSSRIPHDRIFFNRIHHNHRRHMGITR